MACFFNDWGIPDDFDQDAYDSLFEKITEPSPFDYSWLCLKLTLKILRKQSSTKSWPRISETSPNRKRHSFTKLLVIEHMRESSTPFFSERSLRPFFFIKNQAADSLCQLANCPLFSLLVVWSCIIREFKRMNPNGHGCRRTQKAPWSIQGCKRQAISSNSNGKWNAESTTENSKGVLTPFFKTRRLTVDSWWTVHSLWLPLRDRVEWTQFTKSLCTKSNVLTHLKKMRWQWTWTERWAFA